MTIAQSKNYTPDLLFGSLPLIRLRFHATIPNRDALPPFLGSAWRGLIGWEIQRLLCPFPRKRPCGPCIIKEQCPYFQIIEEQAPPEGLTDFPRGYILYPRDTGEKDRVCLDLTLVGDMSKYLEIMVMVIMEGGSAGLGKNRVPYRIDAISEILPNGDLIPVIPDRNGPPQAAGPFELNRWIDEGKEASDDSAVVRFTTPVRLRKKGVYVKNMDWPFFFGVLVRRLEALNVVYNNGPPLGKETWMNIQEMFSSAGPAASNLIWDDMARYSSRLKQKVPMGGLTGTIRPGGSKSLPAPWWRAAELIHVGKGAAMGWGKIDFL